MSLTDAQMTTLANHIRANTDPLVITALADRNDTELARLYNLDSSIYVWRTVIKPSEYKRSIVWTEVDTLNTGKARIWEWVSSMQSDDLDASDPNIRAGISEAFGAGTTTRANLLSIAKRLSSLYESVFAVGTGTEADPGKTVLEGPVTIQIIGKALNENP